MKTSTYRIETRHGFYSAYEKVGAYSFAARYDATFRTATTYDVKARALKMVKRLRLEGHVANLHQISENG